MSVTLLTPLSSFLPCFFSKPTPIGVAGYDVNDGCKLSYTGEDVTAENFLAVLKGDSKTTGKTLSAPAESSFLGGGGGYRSAAVVLRGV